MDCTNHEILSYQNLIFSNNTNYDNPQLSDMVIINLPYHKFCIIIYTIVINGRD